MAADPVLRLEAVRREFGEVVAVAGVDLALGAGELGVILGRSGSGKTTLLSLAAGLDLPDGGRVFVEGEEVSRLAAVARERLRLRAVGLILQAPGLLPLLTAAENVALPLRAAGVASDRARSAALSALDLVGLHARAEHRAYELSGGEQQRVAVARAMVKKPVILIADEPTGQLDTETAAAMMKVLRQLADDGLAILLATHDESFKAIGDSVRLMDDGRLLADAAGK